MGGGGWHGEQYQRSPQMRLAWRWMTEASEPWLHPKVPNWLGPKVLHGTCASVNGTPNWLERRRVVKSIRV